MSLEKENQGITLVSLVITIIIIVILTLVAVSAISGEDGLFGQANRAGSLFNERAKNEDDIIKELLGENSLEDTSNEFVEETMPDKIIANYEVLSKTETRAQIRIFISSVNGIEKIICPNNQVIKVNNSKQYNFIYDIELSSNYEFKIKTRSQELTLELVLPDSNSISISDASNLSYPVIFLDRIEFGNTLKITYPNDSQENYYSIDNGATWQKYTGKLVISEDVTIKAKSIIDNKITEVLSKEVSYTDSNTNAILENAYDQSTTTYDAIAIGTSKRIYVSEDLRGGHVEINLKTKYGTTVNRTSVFLYTEEGQQIPNIGQYFSYSGGTTTTKTLTYQIPTNCEYIEFSCGEGTSTFTPYLYVNDIKVINVIKFKPSTVDARLSLDKLEDGYYLVALSTHNSNLKMQYSINSGEWIPYTTPFKAFSGDVVSANAITDSVTNKTIVYKSTMVNATVNQLAVDNSTSTYSNLARTALLYLDSQLAGEEINVNIKNHYGSADVNRTSIFFYDKDKNKINGVGGEFIYANGTTVTQNLIYRIPENCEYMAFGVGTGAADGSFVPYMYINDIKIVHTVTITQRDVNPILKDTGLEGGYRMVQLDTYKKGYTFEYSTDSVNWNTYNGEFKVEGTKTVSARAIDNRWNTKSIVNTKTMSGNFIDYRCFDGDKSTYANLTTSNKLYIDSSMYGKSIKVNISTHYGTSVNRTGIFFYNTSGTQISGIGQYFEKSGGTTTSHELTYTIPTNCAYIEFWVGAGNNAGFVPYTYLYDITIL